MSAAPPDLENTARYVVVFSTHANLTDTELRALVAQPVSRGDDYVQRRDTYPCAGKNLEVLRSCAMSACATGKVPAEVSESVGK